MLQFCLHFIQLFFLNFPHYLINFLFYIILISSQSVIALTPQCCVITGEAANTNFIVLALSTAFEASMLIITPSWSRFHCKNPPEYSM
jgi:hypothetical protein